MYRMRQLFTLSKIDEWNEAIAIVDEVNKLCASKGWSQATVYTRTVGRFGEICIETEYPDLATLERENKDGRTGDRRVDATHRCDCVGGSGAQRTLGRGDTRSRLRSGCPSPALSLVPALSTAVSQWPPLVPRLIHVARDAF